MTTSAGCAMIKAMGSREGDGGNNFTGAEFAAARAGGFSVSHWLSDGPPASAAGHGHRHAHLVLVTGGRYMTPLAQAGAGRPAFIYSPPQTYHRDHVGRGGGSFLTITLPDAVVDAMPRAGLPGQAGLVCDAEALGLALAIRREAASGADDLHLESLCLELLGAMAAMRPERRRPGWLRRAIDQLLDDACERTQLGDVAAAAGVHPVHLARAFRRFVGCTPGEMRLSRRLKAAADRLAEGRMPLAEVALETGFGDQSHLTRVFTSRYGVAPGRYRAIVGSSGRPSPSRRP
jgi:AraC family transcriptional regulator